MPQKLSTKSTWSNCHAPPEAILTGALLYPCFDDLLVLACRTDGQGRAGLDALERIAAKLKIDGRLRGCGAEIIDRMLGNIRWAMDHRNHA